MDHVALKYLENKEKKPIHPDATILFEQIDNGETS